MFEKHSKTAECPRTYFCDPLPPQDDPHPRLLPRPQVRPGYGDAPVLPEAAHFRCQELLKSLYEQHQAIAVNSRAPTMVNVAYLTAPDRVTLLVTL